ncbi:MAG: sigma 54-interacting transcriptional regulator [Acidobacteriota bacterium]
MSADTKLTAAGTTSAGDLGERAMLVVYEGEGAQATTRVVELPDGAQLTVGRTHRANIRIDSERVSRIHATIVRRGLELTIEDNGSRNGTWVDGAAIQGVRRLASGDAIAIGPATIVVNFVTRAATDSRIHSARELEERLASEVDRARTYRRTFALARIACSGDAGAVDDALERIAGATRVMDLAAEYAPGELAIVLAELDGAAAAATARGFAETARGLDVRVGVAAYPEHATTADELIARAGTAMKRGEVGLPSREDATATADAPIVIDPQMQRVYELVRKVANHPLTVLVYGETGVGKEVIAAAIHRASDRKAGPLVRLNCASLPDTLLESELFGHEKGAFTGADRKKHGYFEVAAGGTLFLDEVGELSPATQAKLLRVLEVRTITRVGGTDEIAVDVRVVCATNRDLDAEVARGAFRSDLLFRISGFTILVPPLRDRPAEIVPLARAFAGPQLALSPAAEDALQHYPWPGNVRELRNAIERARVVCSEGTIELEDLPDRVRELRGPPRVAGLALPLDGQRDVRDHITALEREAIVAALAACGGSQTKAAKQLGISRRALIYRMERHGLKPPPAASTRR